MERSMCLRRGVLYISAAAVVLVSGSCATVRVATGGEGTAARAKEEIIAVVERFEQANREGDFRSMRRTVTGKMQDWARETAPKGWAEDLQDPGNEFQVQTVEMDSDTKARSRILFRSPSAGEESVLEFTFLRGRGGWKISESRRVKD